jgi:hypothetical protein
MAATVTGKRERTTARKASKGAQLERGRASEDDIRILAYHLYERRSRDGLTGDAESDWIEAERLLSGTERRARDA